MAVHCPFLNLGCCVLCVGLRASVCARHGRTLPFSRIRKPSWHVFVWHGLPGPYTGLHVHLPVCVHALHSCLWTCACMHNRGGCTCGCMHLWVVLYDCVSTMPYTAIHECGCTYVHVHAFERMRVFQSFWCLGTSQVSMASWLCTSTIGD